MPLSTTALPTLLFDAFLRPSALSPCLPAAKYSPGSSFSFTTCCTSLGTSNSSTLIRLFCQNHAIPATNSCTHPLPLAIASVAFADSPAWSTTSCRLLQPLLQSLLHLCVIYRTAACALEWVIVVGYPAGLPAAYLFLPALAFFKLRFVLHELHLALGYVRLIIHRPASTTGADPRLCRLQPGSVGVVPLLARSASVLPLCGVAAVPSQAGTDPVWTVEELGLVGTRAALFAALLVAVSPLQVFDSQSALLTGRWCFSCLAIFPFALYAGIRERRTTALVLGVVAMILAVRAHPVAALLVGGPALWLAASYARPDRLKAAWSQPSVRLGSVVALLIIAAITIKLLPILQSWVSMHDRNPGMGQFLLPTKRANGPKQALLLLAFLEGLTLPVALAAAAGVYLLWRQRDRTLGVFLRWLALFPMAFIALVSTRTPVSTFYPCLRRRCSMWRSACLLDYLTRVDWKLRPQVAHAGDHPARDAHIRRSDAGVAISQRAPVRVPDGGPMARAAVGSRRRGVLRSAHGGDGALSEGTEGREAAAERRGVTRSDERHPGLRARRRALGGGSSTGPRVSHQLEGGGSGRLDVPELPASHDDRHGAAGFPAAVPSGIPLPSSRPRSVGLERPGLGRQLDGHALARQHVS